MQTDAEVARIVATQVPELRAGSIEIVAVARAKGARTKIAVRAVDATIDPIEVCLGNAGERVTRIVQLLGDADVDLVPWHADPVAFVCAALAPLVITRIVIDEDRHRMELFVPDELIHTAPGDDGTRLVLAADLTGWGLDVFRLSRWRPTPEA